MVEPDLMLRPGISDPERRAHVAGVPSPQHVTDVHAADIQSRDPLADAIDEAVVVSTGASRRPTDPDVLAQRQHAAERIVRRYYYYLRRTTKLSVAAKLRARKLKFSDQDYEEFYNSAWLALYQYLLGGEKVENLSGWLVNAMWWLALGEHRRRQSRPKVVEYGDGWQDEGVVDRDFAQDAEDRALIRSWRTGLRTELNRTERRAAALRMICGYSRIEIAEILEVDRDKADKIMDAIHTKTQNLLRVLDDGEACAERRSLITAYAYGVLNPDGERYAAARQHIMECPACAATVRAQRGLCLLIPIPILASVATAGGGILSMLGGLFKGSGAGAASAGVGSAGAGTTGGLLATCATVKGVASLCALCLGGAVITATDHPATSATTQPSPAAVARANTTPRTLPAGPSSAALAPRASTPTAPTTTERVTQAHHVAQRPQATSAAPGHDFTTQPPPRAAAPPPRTSTGSASTTYSPPGQPGDEFSPERTEP